MKVADIKLKQYKSTIIQLWRYIDVFVRSQIHHQIEMPVEDGVAFKVQSPIWHQVWRKVYNRTL